MKNKIIDQVKKENFKILNGINFMLMCNACKKLFDKLLKFINIFAWGSFYVMYLTD